MSCITSSVTPLNVIDAGDAGAIRRSSSSVYCKKGALKILKTT